MQKFIVSIVVAVSLFLGYTIFTPNVEASHGSFYWAGGYNYDGQWVTCLYSGTTHTALFCY